MNVQIIEIVLGLFWVGFIGLNLWLWRSYPLEQAPMPTESGAANAIDVNQGDRHATVHH
jgi:hypothetical protein